MIGRNFSNAEYLTLEDEYLASFIDMAVEKDERSELTYSEEDYLSLFMAHMRSDEELPSSTVGFVSDNEVSCINYSKFISSYNQLDPNSGTGLIRLTSVIIPSEGIKVHSDDVTLLCYSLSGEGEVIIDGESVACRKYDCVWADCTRLVRYRPMPGKTWECVFIRIHGGISPSFFARTNVVLRNSGRLRLTFGAVTRFRSIIWQLLSPRTECGPSLETTYAHLLMNLFTEVELAVISTSEKQFIIPDVIVGIQNYMDRNYGQDISLDLLAKKFSISKFHMSRMFKRYVGKSPNDYLIDVRMEKSKELLVDTGKTIGDIGLIVGIPNTNHFLYLFKTREGITPSAFRKQRI